MYIPEYIYKVKIYNGVTRPNGKTKVLGYQCPRRRYPKMLGLLPSHGHARKSQTEPIGIGLMSKGLRINMENIMTVRPYQYQLKTMRPYISV